ncbi:MAG TPA: type III pantothenate kinase [Candidatus Methylacidiphilales bacterium]|nr:type III pantothenate kinase [Candidatus Methylacidiphilales bacterium]
MTTLSTKFLLIDAGNSRLKWAVAGPRGRIVPSGDIATQEAAPARIFTLARKYPNHRAVLASVVPKFIPIFRGAFTGRLHVVSGKSPALGLEFDYSQPSELGADRLAAAVAVHAEGVWPAIIIAAGTATAFTVLDERGQVCGGAIAPGLQAQLAALLAATAKLPSIAPRPPRHALARSTREAIRSGLIHGFRGGVKEIVRRLSSELTGPGQPAVFLTGGNAAWLAGALDGSVQMRPLLVFEGLRMIGARLTSR